MKRRFQLAEKADTFEACQESTPRIFSRAMEPRTVDQMASLINSKHRTKDQVGIQNLARP